MDNDLGSSSLTDQCGYSDLCKYKMPPDGKKTLVIALGKNCEGKSHDQIYGQMKQN